MCNLLIKTKVSAFFILSLILVPNKIEIRQWFRWTIAKVRQILHVYVAPRFRLVVGDVLRQ